MLGCRDRRRARHRAADAAAELRQQAERHRSLAGGVQVEVVAVGVGVRAERDEHALAGRQRIGQQLGGARVDAIDVRDDGDVEVGRRALTAEQRESVDSVDRERRQRQRVGIEHQAVEVGVGAQRIGTGVAVDQQHLDPLADLDRQETLVVGRQRVVLQRYAYGPATRFAEADLELGFALGAGRHRDDAAHRLAAVDVEP